jgi:hypothetical protein
MHYEYPHILQEQEESQQPKSEIGGITTIIIVAGAIGLIYYAMKQQTTKEAVEMTGIATSDLLQPTRNASEYTQALLNNL